MQTFYKQAGSVAGSTKEFINILKKTGRKLSDTPSALARQHLVGNEGTGSFVLDALKRPIKNTKVGKRIDNAILRGQTKLTDLDMKAGKKIYSMFTNNAKPSSLRHKIGDAFVSTHTIDVKNNGGAVQDAIKVKAAKLTNPISKTKDAVLPIAGSFAIGSKVFNQGEDGDSEMKTATSQYKQYLIDKIAGYTDGCSSDEVCKRRLTKSIYNHNKHQNELCKKAYVLLKKAAQNQKFLLESNEKLALENKRMHLEKIAEDRKERVKNLVSAMLSKHMLKKTEIEAKASELMGMEDEALAMLEKAIKEMPNNNENKQGVDNLTFLCDNNNKGEQNKPKKQTLADAINDMANNR